METTRMIKELEKHNPDALIRLHHMQGPKIYCITKTHDGTQYVSVLETRKDLQCAECPSARPLTVRLLKERLEKNLHMHERVKDHVYYGNEALFVVGFKDRDEVVVIEDETDNDLRAELDTRFEQASEEQVDELDFFIDLFELGFTLDHIKHYLPERYQYAKRFAEEHGLC